MSGALVDRTEMSAEPAPGPAAISIEGVTKSFGEVAALKGVSLEIPRGCFVSLLGPSGCGKTTLLRLIGGFERQDRGTIRVNGERIDGLPPNKRHVNTVFQSYALFPHRSVFRNVAFPLEIMGVGKAERRERVAEMLSLVRLEGMEDRGANQLSGGQAQRVALARALVGRPDVLLLDEPLAALDLKLRKAMQLELRRIQQELGTTFIFVTHDQGEALAMSDRIVLMDQGEIVQVGDPVELYERPNSVFASHFIGEANLLPGRIERKGALELQLAVGGTLVVAPDDPELAVGEEAMVSIRPERLSMAENGAAASCDNALVGRIKQQIFLGHLVRYLVEIPPDLVLTVEEPAPQSQTWQVGAEVTLCCDKDAVRVLALG